MLRARSCHPLVPSAFRYLGKLCRERQAFALDTRRHVLLLIWSLSCVVAWLNPLPAFAQGIITTVAGNGARGISGNGGQAIATPLSLGSYTGGVVVDGAGNLYIADTGSHRVYKVGPNGQRLTVAGSDCWVCAVDEQLAGDPRAGYSGDGGQAFNALLNSPSGLGIDAVGNLYIVDTGNQRIRKVSPGGMITTVAGNGGRGFSGDGGPATSASLNLSTVWIPTLYSGNVAADAAGNLYIADTGNGRIRKVSAAGIITTAAYVNDPWSVAVDLAGNLYIAENTPHLGGTVRKITPGGAVTLIAGSRNEPVAGPFGPFGDGGLATDAWLLFCTGVAVDNAGNVYIADSGAHRIRKVDQQGTITTVAGSGNPVFTPPEPILGEGGGYAVPGGFSGDGGLSTTAQLNAPWGVAVDAGGTVYIADSLNNRIRKVSADSNGPSPNPINDSSFFVRQNYLDFLNREPDAGGLAYWLNEITKCGSDTRCIHERRVAVSDAFFFEPEYQRSGAYVFRVYRLAFGNNQPFPNPDAGDAGASFYPGPNFRFKFPSHAKFRADRLQVIGGGDLTQLQIDFANAFVQRPEFLANYPASLSGTEFINALLANIQSADGADLSSQQAALMTLYDQGGRGAVVYRLADDDAQSNPINNRPFIDAEYNLSFVMNEYAAYLRRDGDANGMNFWLIQVNSGPLRDATRQHAMVCSFITSTEYQRRFGSLVTRSNADCSP